MAHIVLNDPIVGNPDATEEPKIPADFDLIANAINGNLDSTNLAPSLLDSLLRINGSNSVHYVAFGIANVTGPFNGANTSPNNQYSNITTVTHTLGVVPIAVLASIYDGNSTISPVATAQMTTTTFQVQSINISTAYSTYWGQGSNRTTIPFAWLALA